MVQLNKCGDVPGEHADEHPVMGGHRAAVEGTKILHNLGVEGMFGAEATT